MSQIKRLILAEKNYNVKQLQAVSGMTFEPRKIKTDLNNNAASTITLTEFATLCIKLAIKHSDKFPDTVRGFTLSIRVPNKKEINHE